MRLYRALLRLLPLEFRDRFGREMEGLFRAQHREATAEGIGGRLRLWAETLGGVVSVAPREHLSILRQDTSVAWRMMCRRPALSLTAVAILGLALGATTAVFSVVSGVLLRPLPYPEPSQVVVIGERERDGAATGVSPPMVVEWHAQSRTLAGVAAMSRTTLTSVGSGAETPLDALAVTGAFFDVLGVAPAIGRVLPNMPPLGPAPEEVVLSHAFWMRRFAGDPGAIGRTLDLATRRVTIVGVMPPVFRSPLPADVFVPLVFKPDDLLPRFLGARYLDVIGRLRPGTESRAAEADLLGIARRARTAAGFARDDAGARVIRMHDDLVASYRQTLWLMFGAVSLVLLVAGVNVSSLLLARTVTRQEELAIRAALGAPAVRLLRQVLTEAVVLAALSGCAALLIAAALLGPLMARLPPGLPRLDEVSLDWRVLMFAAAAALAVGIGLGLAPAGRVSTRRLFGLLTTAGRQTGSRDSVLARHALLTFEVAVTLVLLVAGALMVRSFRSLQAVDLGFSPTNVMTAFLSLPDARYPTPDHKRAFVVRLLEEARAIPGAVAVGVDCNPPLSSMQMWFGYQIDGRPAPKGDRMSAQYHCVAGRSFAALGMRILEGRAFDDRDRGDSQPIAVINAWMARRYWPGESPLGRRIHVASQHGLVGREIVGVAASLHHQSLTDPEGPEIWVPFNDDPWSMVHLVVRVDGARATAPEGVRVASARVDPSLRVLLIHWIEDDVAALLAPARFQTLLLGGFALTALVLSLVCIHGVMSYAVSLRAGEMGIRIALGASPTQVAGLVVRDALRPVGAGLLLGLVTVFALARTLHLDAAGLQELDPAAVASSVVLLLLVSLAATWLPARRATRVDPLTALRAT